VLAVEVNKPLVIVRKKSFGLASEVSVQQVTGYSKSQLFINGLEPHDKVVIVDDVLSTGGTLKAVITALNNMGVNIVDVIVVIEKGENRERIELETGVEIKPLIKVDVVDEKVIVTEI
jgi:adenine phosphoribosyltransferase